MKRLALFYFASALMASSSMADDSTVSSTNGSQASLESLEKVLMDTSEDTARMNSTGGLYHPA